jgi:hypothetical protein
MHQFQQVLAVAVVHILNHLLRVTVVQVLQELSSLNGHK